MSPCVLKDRSIMERFLRSCKVGEFIVEFLDNRRKFSGIFLYANCSDITIYAIIVGSSLEVIVEIIDVVNFISPCIDSFLGGNQRQILLNESCQRITEKTFWFFCRWWQYFKRFESSSDWGLNVLEHSSRTTSNH